MWPVCKKRGHHMHTALTARERRVCDGQKCASPPLARSLGAARNCKKFRKNVFPCLVTGTRAHSTEFILITTETAAKRPSTNKRCNSTKLPTSILPFGGEDEDIFLRLSAFYVLIFRAHRVKSFLSEFCKSN